MRKILLASPLICCTSYIYAQKNTSDATRIANEVIEMLKHDHAHGHHHAGTLPAETRLSEVKMTDQSVTFYLDIPLHFFEKGYDEMLFEEVGLRLFNSLPESEDLTTFEILIKNAEHYLRKILVSPMVVTSLISLILSITACVLSELRRVVSAHLSRPEL